MMTDIQIHAGDFTKGKGDISVSEMAFSLTVGLPEKSNTFTKQDIDEISVATEENLKRMEGKAGWETVDILAIGSVGLLASLLLGGKRKDITFILKLKDGRKMLATVDNKTYAKLAALGF